MRVKSVILAAGQGTRMRSSLPKVLHPILGRPMVAYALDVARRVTQAKPVVVIGHAADQVRAALEGQAEFVLQAEQLGTGHAVQQVAPLLRGQVDHVLVTYGDMPLLRAATLQRLLEAQQAHDGPISLLTVVADDPRGFGRILRAEDGRVLAIVEEAHATPEQRAIRELNTGVFCFQADWLWDALGKIQPSPKGEYYLTDLVEIAVKEGRSVQALPVEDPVEVIGVNTRLHLAEATAQMQQRINQAWMLAGVTIVDPRSTYIEPDVRIGRDTVLWPGTLLEGDTVIGEGCEIGPHTRIQNAQIGDRCKITFSVIEQAVLEDEVDVGPFGHLRKGAHLARGVHMGNFGEVKNSYLGPGTKMGHFSYIGDATIGEDVNIGAGTITCNYDGERKHPTEIGDQVFIGSDTMLVAPLKIGKGARTGAGSVVTRDVPEDTLVVGVPARAIKKLTSE